VLWGASPEVCPTSAEAENSLVKRFERVVAAYGSRTALVSDLWPPTYEESNFSANRLGHEVLTHTGMLGNRVAILMQQDAPVIVAVLGVLKSQGARQCLDERTKIEAGHRVTVIPCSSIHAPRPPNPFSSTANS